MGFNQFINSGGAIVVLVAMIFIVPIGTYTYSKLSPDTQTPPRYKEGSIDSIDKIRYGGKSKRRHQIKNKSRRK